MESDIKTQYWKIINGIYPKLLYLHLIKFHIHRLYLKVVQQSPNWLISWNTILDVKEKQHIYPQIIHHLSLFFFLFFSSIIIIHSIIHPTSRRSTSSFSQQSSPQSNFSHTHMHVFFQCCITSTKCFFFVFLFFWINLFNKITGKRSIVEKYVQQKNFSW